MFGLEIFSRIIKKRSSGKLRVSRFPARSSSGYTIIEVMVALAILSLGIVTIFRSFFICMKQTNHLTARLQANNLLENRVTSTARLLRAYKALPHELDPSIDVVIGGKTYQFKQFIKIGGVDDFLDLFRLEVSVTWTEGAKEITLSRVAYISDF